MYLNWSILYRVNVHKRWLIKYGFAYLLKNTIFFLGKIVIVFVNI